MPKRFAVSSSGSSSLLPLPLFPELEQSPTAAAELAPEPEPSESRKPPARAGLLLPRFATAGPLRIAIEGPPRVGKSTLTQLLAERTGAARIAEPVNNPFLSRFYAGEPGMAFATQMWFLRERLAQQAAAAMLHGPVVSDYILEKDKLFAFLNLSDAELGIYKEFHQANAVVPRPPDLVVYLQASPSVLLERRMRKGIVSEQELDEDYFTQVCQAYEHFFSRYTATRLLVVDTSAIDFVHSERERALLIDRILAPVHGREHFAPLAQIA